jgi:hypothetical protein
MPILVALVLLVPATAAPAAPPRPEAVDYVLTESSRSVTPRGEQAGGVTGHVVVLSGRAAWKLASGTFPRSTASMAIAEGGSVTLVDRAEKVAGETGVEEFDRLFLGPEARDGGLSSAAVRDLVVSLLPGGDGVPFAGKPSARHVLSVSYRLIVSTPGRSTSVKHELRATIDTVAGLDAARSPLDGLGRLFPVRGAARESVAAELGRLDGFPVAVRVESTGVMTSEPAGMARDPSDPGALPVRSSATLTREVAGLVRRRSTESDKVRLAVPEEVRSIPVQRLLREPTGLER